MFLVHGFLDRREVLRLGDDEAGVGRGEMVDEFVRGVRGVRAGEDATGADDGEDEHWVVDLHLY